MFLKNVTHRQFEYKPMFYHPEEIQDENEPRIRFRRIVKRKEVPKRSPITLVILILILIFLLKYMNDLSNADKKNQPAKAIRIEVID